MSCLIFPLHTLCPHIEATPTLSSRRILLIVYSNNFTLFTVDDLCFDISRFNSAAYRISDIVDSLILQDKGNERGMHRYERTLKYVAFPPLDTMVTEREAYAENLNLKKGHDEVFRVLDWLSVKMVTKIIKLTVPDRLVNPHDDLKMAEYVKKFKIEVLDWKVLDLSISIFRSKNPKDHMQQEIKELYLYSSGKRAAINHWFNKDDGVESLSKVSDRSPGTSHRPSNIYCSIPCLCTLFVARLRTLD